MSGTARASVRRSGAWLGALVVLGALLLAAWAHRETLVRPYVVNNDSCQHVYWMQQWRHPQLFAGDLLTVYAREYQPWGWRALYRAVSPVVDPLALSRWLPLLLFAGCCGLVYRWASTVSGRYGGVLAAALFAASPLFLQKMAGGHPRAFAVPILLLTLVLLQDRRRRALGLVLAVASLLYPMAFLLAAATAGLAFLTETRGRPRREAWRAWAPVLAGILVGGALLVAQYGVARDPRIGPTVSGEAMRVAPEFYAGGRQAHLPTPGPLAVLEESLRRALPDVRTLLPGEHRGRMPRLEVAALLLLVALALGLALRRRWPLPNALGPLLVAAYALYAAAELLLFRLFLPRRYVMYALPLLAVVLLAILGTRLTAALAPPARRALRGALLVLVLLLAPGIDGAGLDDYSANAELYAFLRTLPEDALIAPHPYVGDGIPLFTGRTVLLSYELSNPYFVTYWQTMSGRLDDFFDAYYAEDPTAVTAFCHAYDVDYLVVDRHYLEREVIDSRRGAYFEPFSDRIRELARKHPSFALDSPPAEARVFTSSDGRTEVLSCQGWERAARTTELEASTLAPDTR